MVPEETPNDMKIAVLKNADLLNKFLRGDCAEITICFSGAEGFEFYSPFSAGKQNPSIYTLSASSTQTAFEELLKTLNCTPDDFQEIHPEVNLQLLPKYQLKRMDDNGVEYLVDTYDYYSQANARVEEFESHHHKQTYWIDRVKSSF